MSGRSMRKVAGLCLAAAFVLPLSSVSASAVDWTLTLGVEGRVMPSYKGSDRYVLRPIPLFDIRRAGTPERFQAPRDGASIGLLEYGRFRAGPTFKIVTPRDDGDDVDLTGLGDVDWTLEAGLFAEYWFTDWLRARAEVRKGFGGHHGIVGDLTADVVVPVTPKLTFSAGPRMTVVSNSANQPYFSIDPTQSAASGLPVYDAGGGIQSYGLGAQARYKFTQQFAGHVFVEYERLADDVANSPLVTQRGSAKHIQGGIGASYAFDIPGLW